VDVNQHKPEVDANGVTAAEAEAAAVAESEEEEDAEDEEEEEEEAEEEAQTGAAAKGAAAVDSGEDGTEVADQPPAGNAGLRVPDDTAAAR
jgi:hypothetical protein